LPSEDLLNENGQFVFYLFRNQSNFSIIFHLLFSAFLKHLINIQGSEIDWIPSPNFDFPYEPIYEIIEYSSLKSLHFLNKPMMEESFLKDYY
jgi:hypothetical protein